MSWGEIYNTSWWGIALDTARTVKARPDFFGSQLNLLTSEQPNLVTNGTFDTDSDWSKGAGWSISGGKANVNATSFTDLYQNIGTVVGKTYKISFEVSNYVFGSVKIILGYGSTPELPLLVATSNGVYEVETTPNAINPQNIYISTKTANTQLSIDNVSVQLVRAELDQIEAKKCVADWIHTTALKDLNN